MTARFKLGKKPARPWAAPGSSFRFASYADAAALPVPSAMFGHASLIAAWPMFANDRYGDCVWAGAAHETMLLTKEGGNAVSFTDDNVLSDYAAVTGFMPDNPASDQGTDMQVAANYRRQTGIVDAAGRRHRIASFLAIEPGNMQDLLLASYMFVAGVGLRLPSSALDQTGKGETWDVVEGSPIEGGHYVPLLGRQADGLLVFVSWGAVQLATERFVQTFCDEAMAILSQEDLVNDKSPDGFDLATLRADLARLA
jgi:hypothetical protein